MFQRTLRQTIRQMCGNTFVIWRAAPLHYLLITVKVIAFENVSFSDTQCPKAVSLHTDSRCETLSAYQRQFNINNSDTIISKRKIFFSIFSCISKIYIKFSTCPKKWWSLQLMYFRKNWLQKIWLDKCLKSGVSEDP